MATIEQIIKDNENLVYFVLKKYFTQFLNDEDMIQIGRIGLWQAAKGFDPSRGTAFSTYAVAAIYHEITKELRKQHTQSRSGAVTSLQEPIVTSNDDGTELCLEDTLSAPINAYDALDCEVDVTRALAKLKERERGVLRAYADGYTMEEIGHQHGITRAGVSRIIQSLRPRLRRELKAYRT